MSEKDNELRLDARTRAVVDGLPPDDREQLVALVDHAAAYQRAMLEQALEDAVRVIPAPFRRRMRKMFLG